MQTSTQETTHLKHNSLVLNKQNIQRQSLQRKSQVSRLVSTYVHTSPGTVPGASASSLSAEPWMLTGVSGCVRNPQRDLWSVMQSCTWFFAAHVEAIHGIMASLLLSLTDPAFKTNLISNLWTLYRKDDISGWTVLQRAGEKKKKNKTDRETASKGEQKATCVIVRHVYCCLS